jgi:hypothetical protein
MLWSDTFRVGTGAHLRIADILPCVDLIAWDNLRSRNGYRGGKVEGGAEAASFFGNPT